MFNKYNKKKLCPCSCPNGEGYVVKPIVDAATSTTPVVTTATPETSTTAAPQETSTTAATPEMPTTTENQEDCDYYGMNPLGTCNCDGQVYISSDCK